MSVETKIVFDLRKSGKIGEAYEKAQQLFEANPEDEWVKKAVFYTLYDKIKAAVDNGDKEGLKLWVKKVDLLQLPKGDEVIDNCQSKIRRMLDPNHDLLQQASEYSKQKQYKKAVEIYKSVIADYKEDEYVNNSYGWDLYHLAKECLDKVPTNTREVKIFLNDYLKLSNPRPSHLHSVILRMALKLSRDEKLDMVVFARMWDLSKLDHEDFQTSVSEGKTYPSLAEQAYQELFKQLSKSPTRENAQYFDSFLEKAIETFPDNIWLIYYKVKILSSLREFDVALRFMISVLRKKSGEHWAWRYAGDIMTGSDNLEMAVSCYCKALLCSGEEDQLIKVRAGFVPLLVRLGRPTEAMIEVNKILAGNDEKLKQVMKKYQATPWCDPKVDTNASNKQFYLERSQKATDLLHQDLPWHKALYQETFKTKQKNKELARFTVEEESGGLKETVASTKNFPVLNKMTRGQAVKLKYSVEGDKLNVLALEPREDGSAWDLLPDRIAVVDGVNPVKNIVYCISIKGKRTTYSKYFWSKDMLAAGSIYKGTIHIHNASELSKFKVGTPLEIKAIMKTGKEEEYLDIVSFKFADPQTDMGELVCSFSGNIRITETGQGFVDNVFFHASTVTENHLADMDKVSGKALRNFDKKKKAWGWKCCLIEDISKYDLLKELLEAISDD